MRAGLALAAVLAASLACTAALARDTRVALTVKPVLCITDRRNASCEMLLLIAWRSDAEGDYCLYSDVTSTPISCWARESSGRVEDDRVVERPLTYWLASGESDVRLAEATVDVVTTDADDRRRHRQRRHAWSLL